MTVSTESVSPLKKQIRETNAQEASGVHVGERRIVEIRHNPIIERVNEILGYDIVERWLIREGSREMAEESLNLSESNLAAGLESFPPE